MLKALTLLFLLSSHIYTLFASNSKVEKLTQANFKQKVLDSNQPWIIKFYAPWCGHCKSMANDFNKAAEQLDGIVRLGAVDMTTDQQAGARYNVQGFPTLKVFGRDKNKPSDYNRGRTTQDFVQQGLDLVNQMVKQKGGSTGGSTGGQQQQQQQQQQQRAGGHDDHSSGGPHEVVDLTPSNFKVKDNGEWFVIFFAPWCGHCKSAMPFWEKASVPMKGIVNFGKVDCTAGSNDSLCQQHGVSGYPHFKYFKNNGKSVPYEGARDLAGFVNFARGQNGLDALSDPTKKILP